MALSGIAKAVNDRWNTPILGNYILSLVLLNWRIPTYLLTGSIQPEERISLVQTYMSEGWYKYSFGVAFCITIFYLYLLPLIELVIKSLQIKISIYVFQKNNDLDTKLVLENQYGTSIDKLCAALKNQLFATNKVLAEMNKTLEGGSFNSHDSVILTRFRQNKQSLDYILKDNQEVMNNLSDVFTDLNPPKPLDVVKTAFVNRTNLAKLRKA